MKALLDTHTALFAWMAPEKLSARVRKLIRNRENELYFSQASTFEIVFRESLISRWFIEIRLIGCFLLLLKDCPYR